jgi:hypothetical protein
MSPPIGIAVWRTPSAKPLSVAGNHCITALPLAAFTLAPAAPARPTSRISDPNPAAEPAPTSAAAHASRPLASTSRSPTRSASTPHGSSVNSVPTQRLSSTTPTWTSESECASRSAGASTGSPMITAEKEVCAAVPAARTSQRYRVRARTG